MTETILPRQCSVADCNGKVLARGWCSKHWQRWKKHGDPLFERALKRDSACTVSGCDKRAAGRGWCSTHHARWLRHGTVSAESPVRVASVEGLCCAAPGCDLPVVKGGFCNPHYRRSLRHGDPLGGRGTPAALPDRCLTSDCPSPPWAKGYCKLHYAQDSRGVLGEKSRPCTLCGGSIEMFPAGANGRKLRADVSVCGNCRRPRNPITVAKLSARDGDSCGICGGEVDMNVRHPDPFSPSVDHVVPYSKGGPNTPENCQLAHFRCNLVKNDRSDYVHEHAGVA